MPDEEKATTEEVKTNEDDIKTVISILPVDMILQEFVRLCNKGLEIPVTLFSKGIIITGTIISFKEYMENLKTFIASNPNNENDGKNKIISDGIVKILSTIQEGMQTKNEEDPQMIHLKDVKIFNPTATDVIIPLNSLWRGALDSIDGFIFGVIEARKKDI